MSEVDVTASFANETFRIREINDLIKVTQFLSDGWLDVIRSSSDKFVTVKFSTTVINTSLTIALTCEAT